MYSTALILSRFASIPQLLTMKPKNFPAKTPKAHLVEFVTPPPPPGQLMGARHYVELGLFNLYLPFSQIVTPRPDEVHSTCNCRGAYVHQVSL